LFFCVEKSFENPANEDFQKRLKDACRKVELDDYVEIILPNTGAEG